jgi:MFS family permease
LFSQTYRISHAFIASIIYGISLGSLMVIPYSLILEYIPKGKAGSFVGINTLVISMSQVLAYFTSGMTIDLGGYRINFLQGLISSILGLLILKEIKNSRFKNLS